jgi:class 3 adenylate cyclase
VLFSDIRGFTSSAEHLSVDVHRDAQRASDALTRVIFAYDGTLDKYTGDGLMAAFGAPLAQADHAERAAGGARHAGAPGRAAARVAGGRAACLGDRHRHHSARWWPGTSARPGVDYTVVGDAVIIAARLKDARCGPDPGYRGHRQCGRWAVRRPAARADDVARADPAGAGLEVLARAGKGTSRPAMTRGACRRPAARLTLARIGPYWGRRNRAWPDLPEILNDLTDARDRWEVDGVQYVAYFEPARVPAGQATELVVHLQNALDQPARFVIEPGRPRTGVLGTGLLRSGGSTIKFESDYEELVITLAPGEAGTAAAAGRAGRHGPAGLGRAWLRRAPAARRAQRLRPARQTRHRAT